jgi:hypothetical protein
MRRNCDSARSSSFYSDSFATSAASATRPLWDTGGAWQSSSIPNPFPFSTGAASATRPRRNSDGALLSSSSDRHFQYPTSRVFVGDARPNDSSDSATGRSSFFGRLAPYTSSTAISGVAHMRRNSGGDSSSYSHASYKSSAFGSSQPRRGIDGDASFFLDCPSYFDATPMYTSSAASDRVAPLRRGSSAESSFSGSSSSFSASSSSQPVHLNSHAPLSPSNLGNTTQQSNTWHQPTPISQLPPPEVGFKRKR